MIAAKPWLILGGGLSLAAAVLHLGCIVGGARWYRFLGAGERMARMVERGDWTPHLITFGIAAVLAIWAAYAFSTAGILPRLPLLRVGLVVITAAYLARGLAAVSPGLLRRPDLSADFLLWSSLISLTIGLIYAIGTWLAWPALSRVGAS